MLLADASGFSSNRRPSNPTIQTMPSSGILFVQPSAPPPGLEKLLAHSRVCVTCVFLGSQDFKFTEHPANRRTWSPVFTQTARNTIGNANVSFPIRNASKDIDDNHREPGDARDDIAECQARADWRTHDLLHPMQARYQARPPPAGKLRPEQSKGHKATCRWPTQVLFLDAFFFGRNSLLAIASGLCQPCLDGRGYQPDLSPCPLGRGFDRQLGGPPPPLQDTDLPRIQESRGICSPAICGFPESVAKIGQRRKSGASPGRR